MVLEGGLELGVFTELGLPADVGVPGERLAEASFCAVYVAVASVWFGLGCVQGWFGKLGL